MDNTQCKQCHSSCTTCSGSAISDCKSCPNGKTHALSNDGNGGNSATDGLCIGMLLSKKLSFIWYTSVPLGANSLVGFYFSLHQC